MPVIITVMAPVKAKVGSTVTLKADVRIGITMTGEAYNIVWDGNAPGMPRPTKVIFGASWGETKTINYTFTMPDKVVTFRVMASELDCMLVWCDDVRTEEYVIEPSTKTEEDPTKPPSDFWAMFGDMGKWFSGNLVWVILALATLVVFAYIVKKKPGMKPGGK